MGFFSKYNEIEEGLLDIYSKLFDDMGLPDSRKIVGDMLDQVIENSKKEGRYNLKNVGDILLEKEKSSGNVNENFENKRKEGVRNEDIRWWFNLSDIERMMMMKVDEFHRLALFIKVVKEEGKTDEEASAVVRKHHPMYGDLKDETHGSGDDRPLPLELKDRISIYVEKQGVDNTAFKKQLDSFSTFNALIRKEIRDGNI